MKPRISTTTKRRRGRPTTGIYLLVASCARALVARGQSSAQAITVAEEALRAKYPGARWPAPLNTETVRRTMRRIAARSDHTDARFVPATLELLAKSHPRSEPRSDWATDLAARRKINLCELRNTINSELAKIEKKRGNKR